MHKLPISFSHLPSERSDSPNLALSTEFLSVAVTALSRSTPAKETEFDLTNIPWISPAELVNLTAIIRHLATNQIRCSVVLPLTDSNFSWTLRSYGIPDIFESTTRTATWHKYVSVIGNVVKSRPSDRFSAARTVIPLTWLDRAAFRVPRRCRNLYQEEPEFNPGYTQFLQEILARHGFVAPDAIDTFVRGILREIGWNAIIHSDAGKPGAFAAFAAQILDDGRRLQFALSDVGCGVIHNLRNHYRSAIATGRTQDYAAHYSCAEEGAVLRYAFDPDSTSRTDFPAQYDLFSDRGLSLVADIVRESGNLTIVSAKAEVSVPGRNGESFHVSSLKQQVKGTTLFGELYSKHFAPPRQLEKPLPESLQDVFAADVFPISTLLERGRPQSDRFLRRILRRTPWVKPHAVLDFGFADTAARLVENFTAYFLSLTPVSDITLVNCRSTPISPKRISQQLLVHGTKRTITVRLLRRPNRFQEVAISTATSLSGRGSAPSWKEVHLDCATENALHFRVNSHYLEWSLAFRYPSKGFYRGNIHLLSGNVTDKYFSLVAHLEGSQDSEARRWIMARDRLLRIVRQRSSQVRQKILAFSASTRQILESLEFDNPETMEVWCILSYDVPSKAELAGIISPQDQVVLFTDIISTGSLLEEVVQIVRSIGANVNAVIALLDAREKGAERWDSVFQPEVAGLPLFTAGRLRRILGPSPPLSKTYREKTYWVDPVSAVPVSSIPFSQIDESKIVETAKILAEARCVSIGHYVNGLRHTSVKIDVTKLLEFRASLSELVERHIKSVLQQPEWRDEPFCPSIALVPAGIDRIDRLDPHATPLKQSSSESFARIILDRFNPPPRMTPIARTFEPGGGARCGAIDHIADMADGADLLIVDDGISTGSTVRSLLCHAVRGGARRILVVALLARTTPEELEQWGITSQVVAPHSTNSALVRLITPLFLPIPFDTENTCPQCSTLALIDNRREKNGVSDIGWKSLRQEIQPQADHCTEPSNEYISTWLMTHALSEVASRSVSGFELLRNHLEMIRDAQPPRLIQQEAVIRLFLVEWRLLSRSRLRQVIRKIVRGIVRRQLQSPNISKQAFVEALSLTRSVYPEDYLSTVSQHIRVVAKDEDVFYRCVLHLDTLHPADKNADYQAFLTALSCHFSSSEFCGINTSEKIAILSAMLERSLRSPQSVDRLVQTEAVISAFRSPDILHDVAPLLGEITKLEIHRLEELNNNGYFGPAADDIDSRVLPIFQEFVIERIRDLDYIINAGLRQCELIGVIGADYYCSVGGKNPVIIDEIVAVRDALRNIDEGLQGESALRTAKKAAERVLNRGVMTNCVLEKVLREFLSLTVSDVVDLICCALDGLFDRSQVKIDDEILGDEIRDVSSRYVFCNKAAIFQFMGLTKLNIHKHVLGFGVEAASVYLRVFVSCLVRGDQSFAAFHICNTGSSIVANPVMSYRTRVFNNKDLAHLGAVFRPADRAPDGYGCMSTLELRIASEVKR